jgi:hypothetical protein
VLRSSARVPRRSSGAAARGCPQRACRAHPSCAHPARAAWTAGAAAPQAAGRILMRKSAARRQRSCAGAAHATHARTLHEALQVGALQARRHRGRACTAVTRARYAARCSAATAGGSRGARQHHARHARVRRRCPRAMTRRYARRWTVGAGCVRALRGARAPARTRALVRASTNCRSAVFACKQGVPRRHGRAQLRLASPQHPSVCTMRRLHAVAVAARATAARDGCLPVQATRYKPES